METLYSHTIQFNYPKRLIWGAGCMNSLAEDLIAQSVSRLYVIMVPFVNKALAAIFGELESKGICIKTNTQIAAEPTFNDAKQLIREAREFKADAVVGIGGGSVMDAAKIVAALMNSDQKLKDIAGIGLLKSRNIYLVCVPTTSGTGSEVSPNAILMDDEDYSKKGIISPYLVPDAAYVDPSLTLSLPPDITATTGIDALTHCIEAYTNKYAHPMVDLMALEGIRLIGKNLKQAVMNENDLEARSKMALGSLYGGMCLGPVNTAAVHALAYPLGSDYKMAHGLSNALMLPYVMEFNLEAIPERYAEVAVALGCNRQSSVKETALAGVQYIRSLLKDCGLPATLSQAGVTSNSLDRMASSAIEVQRLLKNNPRDIDMEDIKNIYKKAY